jgi:hypothetical protein
MHPQTTSSRKTKTVNHREKKRKTFALVVEKKGMQYREILDKVKAAIKSDLSKEAVQAIRSTRDGKLLITLEKDMEKMGKLEDALMKAAGSLAVKKTSSNKDMETVHVRGLDATTDKNEVVAALEEKLGTGKNWRLSDLRPNRNNTQAITIIMRKQDADSILTEGSLRIGAVRCRLERRISTGRCYRCWSFDHKAANCDGPDRNNGSVQSPRPVMWCLRKERTTHLDDDRYGAGVGMWPKQEGSA